NNFPLRGGLNRATSEDWIYWQTWIVTSPTSSSPPTGSNMTVYSGRTAAEIANPHLGGIAPYLNLPQNIAEGDVMRCRSDDVTFRTNPNAKQYYPFTYTFNQNLSGEEPDPNTGTTPPGPKKVTKIKRSTEIIMVFEQSFSTLNDAAYWAPEF